MSKLWAPCQYVAAKVKSSSLSEKSERDLPTSEQENGWRVAYGSNREEKCSERKIWGGRHLKAERSMLNYTNK